MGAIFLEQPIFCGQQPICTGWLSCKKVALIRQPLLMAARWFGGQHCCLAALDSDLQGVLHAPRVRSAFLWGLRFPPTPQKQTDVCLEYRLHQFE